jgi:hypothetical protein
MWRPSRLTHQVCIFYQICANGEDVFAGSSGPHGLDIGVTSTFTCRFSPSKFNELKRLLLSLRGEPSGGAMECHTAKFVDEEWSKNPLDLKRPPANDVMVGTSEQGKEEVALVIKDLSELEGVAKEAEGTVGTKVIYEDNEGTVGDKEMRAKLMAASCMRYCTYYHCWAKPDDCSGCSVCEGPHRCDAFCQYQMRPCKDHPASCYGCSQCPGGASEGGGAN